MAVAYAYKGILTPPEHLRVLEAEFGKLADPCPYPRPEGYNGLIHPWPQGPAYCNPLYWGGGITAWVRRALKERDEGRTVILALPVDRWVARLISEADEIRQPEDWYWLTPGGARREQSRPTLLWILRGADK